MISFNKFVPKYNMKNKATSDIKIYQVLTSIGLDNVDINLGDGSFSSYKGIFNLHLYRGSHWVLYIHECYFDSNSCAPSHKLFKFIIKRNGHCLYSEYKIQGLRNKRDSFCASYCFYIFYITKVIGLDFKSAVLNFYYQKIQ